MKHLMLILTLIVCSQYAPARAANGVLPIERVIVDSPVECGAAWDGDWNMIFSYCGDSTTGFTPTEKEQMALVGGIFTHNHPGNCPALSWGDVGTAAYLGMSEDRAVSHIGDKIAVAVMRNPAALRNVSGDMLQAEFDKHLDASYPGWQFPCAAMDATWTALAARYGFEYEVIHD